MSKRGRRRSSRRRKSSSSSKQSASPYIFTQQNHRSSIVCRDETVEKGETDSLRKENVLSGCEDNEDNDRFSDAPPEEKRLKHDRDVSSFHGQNSVYTRTTEIEERGVKIVTSVSVSDVENLAPKVVLQQSHENLSERQTDWSGPVTDVVKVNCAGVHLKLEIQEIIRLNTCGIETTFNFTNESRGTSEMIVERRCERSWTSDGEMPSNVISHRGNINRNLRVTLDSREQTDPCNTCTKASCCQCCSDGHLQTSAELMNHPSNPPSLLNIDSRRKRDENLSGDQFWDIPPPEEFADHNYNTLEDLTHDLASFRIDACGSAYRHQAPFHPNSTSLFRSPFSVQTEESDDPAPSFDQLSESDNYEPMFMRPSLSTARSSFTKDFVCCQTRKSWIRNNSIAAVEHSVCSLLKRRRQTYPGVTQTPGKMQDDYSESFSSLIMCLLPFQAERLGRIQEYDDRFSTLGIENSISPQTRETSKPFSDIHLGKPAFLSPFCRSYSNDMLTVNEDMTQSSRRPQDDDLKQSLSKDMESLDTDTYEPPDSGFDQEMREVESHSPEGLIEDGSGRGLAIQVIPPSCSGSEEQILHPSAALRSEVLKNSVLPESSAMTGSADALQERLMLVDSNASPSICMEQHLQTALENLCMSALEDRDANSPETVVITDEMEEPKPAEKPASVLSSQSTSDETSELQAGTGADDPDKPSEAASRSDKRPADAGVNAKEALVKSDKADKQTIYRSSLELKEHLKPVAHKDRDGSVSDHWAKRRKLFKETKQWSSAGGSSITSDITEESVSEDTHSTDIVVQDNENRGFYTETFHASAWIYQGDDVCSEPIRPSLTTRTRPVSIRERTVRISKGMGEYPWGFRIQFSKPIVVTEVDTNGAAEEAGLMVGDYVLAVNGIDVTSIPHSEAANLARQGPDVLTLTIGSDIARCPNTPRPPCRGYLHKRTQSGLIKGWRKRWFVLTHDCCLHYYKHKRDEGRRRALSSVKLEGAEVGPDDSLGKPFVFKCRPQSAHRIYFLCATSNQEMKRWLEAMEKAIHPITQNHVWVDVTRHNSSLPPLAVKNPDCLGLLNKMDKSRDAWVQHYCILKDGCLYLYSGIRATHAHGGIYLQGYMVREQPYGSKKSTIELKPPSDEFKTFYLCADVSAENKRWIMALRASIKKWLPLHQALQDYMNRLPEETRM